MINANSVVWIAGAIVLTVAAILEPGGPAERAVADLTGHQQRGEPPSPVPAPAEPAQAASAAPAAWYAETALQPEADLPPDALRPAPAAPAGANAGPLLEIAPPRPQGPDYR